MHFRTSYSVAPLSVVTCITLLTVPLLAAIKQPIKKPSYDPTAQTVELFDGLDQGLLTAMLIPKSSLEGNVFIENKTGNTLTVKVPPAVAAVQVLKQGFGGAGAGAGVGGPGAGNGGLGAGQGQQNGQAQALGGGLGGGGLGGGGFGGGAGGGLFSIPPEKIVQLPLKSVCLAHGKPEPRPQMIYKLVRVEHVSKDPALRELLETFAAGNLDQRAVQAAAWYVTDGMTWHQLAGKQISFLGGVPPKPYFTADQLTTARQLVAAVEKRVHDRSTNAPAALLPKL